MRFWCLGIKADPLANCAMPVSSICPGGSPPETAAPPGATVVPARDPYGAAWDIRIRPCATCSQFKYGY